MLASQQQNRIADASSMVIRTAGVSIIRFPIDSHACSHQTQDFWIAQDFRALQVWLRMNCLRIACRAQPFAAPGSWHALGFAGRNLADASCHRCATRRLINTSCTAHGGAAKPDERVALIQGASRGLGLESVRQLLDRPTYRCVCVGIMNLHVLQACTRSAQGCVNDSASCAELWPPAGTQTMQLSCTT